MRRWIGKLYAVIGAAIEVHRVLGAGFLESVYQEALDVELQLRKIPFVSQKIVAVKYKGSKVGEGKLNFLVGSNLVVELKAVENLAPIHTAQVLSYLNNDWASTRITNQLQRPHPQTRHQTHSPLLNLYPWRSWRFGGSLRQAAPRLR